MKDAIHKDRSGLVKMLAWTVCALGAIFYSYEYFLRISPSVMSAELMQHFKISATVFGGVSAFYYYSYVPMQVPVGMLMDRFGPRRLLTLACAICVGGTYLFVASDSLTLAALGRFLVGFGSSFAFVGVLKLATIWLPPSQFAFFVGLSSALGTAGAITGDILLTRLVHVMGWRDTVFLSAALGIVLVLLLWFIVRDTHIITHKKGLKVRHQRASSFVRELIVILSNPQMWIVGLIGCCIYLPTTVFGELWGILYLEHGRFLMPVQAGIGVSALFLGYTIGAPLIGGLSDLLKTRRKLLLIGALISTVLMTILLYVPDLTRIQIYILLFALGIAYSAQALVFVISRELSAKGFAGTAIAVTNMMVMLGGMFFQPLIGVLLDFSWGAGAPLTTHLHKYNVYDIIDYQFALSIIPAGIFLAFILTFFLKETYGTKKF